MRCGCCARVVFKFNSLLGYRVEQFIEKHNHRLVPVQYQHYLKLNRKLDYVHQKFVLDCARSNIGPTHSFKLLSKFLSGQEGVGCSLLDVCNFSRNMKAFVEGSDAQMMLNELSRKKDRCEAFTFHYEVDSEDKLKRLFWCDPISRMNYYIFGDVVAFDTTYSTNKYCMIFAPFTGKDNHGRPVTFAAGLLSGEDADSFSWLFRKFIECMGYAPRLIITDQDLGMKAAIERVLVGTRHRWCMRYIMLKLADKISKELQADEEFKKVLNHYVWSELIEPNSFEAGWSGIMEKYGLVKDDWFISMFEARSFWVPTYFCDFPMSGLLRTTSISESENSLYKRYTRSCHNLLEFWMNFNHALDD